jgi:hypothetical protein
MKKLLIFLLFATACSAQSVSGVLSGGRMCGSPTTAPTCSGLSFMVATDAGLRNGNLNILQQNGKWVLQFPNTGLGTAFVTNTQANGTISLIGANTSIAFSGVDYSGVLTITSETVLTPFGKQWVITGGTITFTARLAPVYQTYNAEHPVGYCYHLLFGVDYTISWRGADWYWGLYTYNSCTGQYVAFDPWF